MGSPVKVPSLNPPLLTLLPTNDLISPSTRFKAAAQGVHTNLSPLQAVNTMGKKETHVRRPVCLRMACGTV